MEITRESLEARRGQLVAERDQLVNNWNALGGAIQDIDHWLAELQKVEIPKASLEKSDA